MTQHVTTVRPGIVGPGEPGNRVFESNFVVECTCGAKIGCATTKQAFAEAAAEDHRRRHDRDEDRVAAWGMAFDDYIAQVMASENLDPDLTVQQLAADARAWADDHQWEYL